MPMEIGILGLPNVGKSTVFNALCGAHQASAENYPFCTVDANHAVVDVPDTRLEKIAGIINPEKITPAAVEFVDIAGLVKDANKGEGLGNQFLANVAETNALTHVVRCFENDNIAHVEGSIDPVRDARIIENELILRDMQLLEKYHSKLGRQVRSDKKLASLLTAAEKLLNHLGEGRPVRTLETEDEGIETVCRDNALVSDKPMLYCANMSEDSFAENDPYVLALREYADRQGAVTVAVSARIEEELTDVDVAEREEFVKACGLSGSALARLIRAAYETLRLVSFFTIQSNLLQAWTVPAGTRAPEAAGTIHTDFETGFLRAEVISYEDLVRHGGERDCRAAGALKTEGKDYVVKDGDIIRFLFKA